MMMILISVAFYPNIASNKKIQKVGMISSVFVEDRTDIDNFTKIMSFFTLIFVFIYILANVDAHGCKSKTCPEMK